MIFGSKVHFTSLLRISHLLQLRLFTFSFYFSFNIFVFLHEHFAKLPLFVFHLAVPTSLTRLMDLCACAHVCRCVSAHFFLNFFAFRLVRGALLKTGWRAIKIPNSYSTTGTTGKHTNTFVFMQRKRPKRRTLMYVPYIHFFFSSLTPTISIK